MNEKILKKETLFPVNLAISLFIIPKSLFYESEWFNNKYPVTSISSVNTYNDSQEIIEKTN